MLYTDPKIGKYRPNFMAVCQPMETPLVASDAWPVASFQTWVRVRDCTGWNDGKPSDELNQAMAGFPSGHTAECFCAATYLALYMNGKLKPFSDYHGSLWKLIVVTAPIYGAMFVAASLTIDHVCESRCFIISLAVTRSCPGSHLPSCPTLHLPLLARLSVLLTAPTEPPSVRHSPVDSVWSCHRCNVLPCPFRLAIRLPDESPLPSVVELPQESPAGASSLHRQIVFQVP